MCCTVQHLLMRQIFLTLFFSFSSFLSTLSLSLWKTAKNVCIFYGTFQIMNNTKSSPLLFLILANFAALSVWFLHRNEGKSTQTQTQKCSAGTPWPYFPSKSVTFWRKVTLNKLVIRHHLWLTLTVWLRNKPVTKAKETKKSYVVQSSKQKQCHNYSGIEWE